MAVTEDQSDRGDPDRFANPACERYPWFELAWMVDDPGDPTELTVTSDTDSTTDWVSIDLEHAVAITEIR